MRTLIVRAKNIPSIKEEVLLETKRVPKALAANNYPANFIHDGLQLNRQQEMNDTDQRGLVILLMPKHFPRELQKFFAVSTSRSPISLSSPSRAYLKSQKRQEREKGFQRNRVQDKI